MKAKNIILGILIIAISSCKSNTDNQVEKVNIKNNVNDSEIYLASKRINESFSGNDSSTIEFISKYLEKDSIKVIITHSIIEKEEIYYLSGNQKIDFFNTPENYTDNKTRRQSEYYNVNGNCYEFNNEGISHNSIYLKKICFEESEKNISLLEIFLLDGD